MTRFAEAGSGKVLSGMAKRIAPDAEATPLNTPADLEAFAEPVLRDVAYLAELPLDGLEPAFVYVPRG